MIAPSMPHYPTRRVLDAVALSTLACLSVHAGCQEVEGGAVEVSWDLRRTDGLDTDCADARVGQVRLWWETATTRRFDAFPCEDARGVTVFDLPAGEAQLWLQPVCEGAGEPAEGTYRAPAAIVRTITEGEVITLDTQVIEVKLTGCTDDAPCVCGVSAATAATAGAPGTMNASPPTPSISPAVRRQLAVNPPSRDTRGRGRSYGATEAVHRPEPVTTSGETTP